MSRKHPGPQRAQTRASMTTEYQERFLPPRCFKTVISTSIQKDPYHPLKGRSNMTTMRSFHVTRKWVQDPPKPPQSPLPPKEHQRPGSAPGNPACVSVNQPPSGVEDYTSVYKNDFRAWIADRRQPYRLNDSLRVNQGLVVINSSSKGGRVQKNSAQLDTNSRPARVEQEPRPFESITSNRSDYVTHLVQPRTRRVRPVDQTNKGPLLEPAASFRPKLAWQTNQELLEGVNDLFQQFKSWSLETKDQCRGKGQATGPPAAHDAFLSTMHAAYTPHKCQRTMPILPSVRTSEKSMKPFLATTTMKEDYRAWDALVTLPHRQKNKHRVSLRT
ncbi:family with sequence similarity 154 member B [Scophthalmus maximus]|uniref:Family with sequence similarity 154 member B n=3 Tax=Scophthalmus maximus TaxID=52904 RepID=A0A2U9B1Q9_SCOMX|nr:stabilizer of axonemal microtubules 2 isoform X2 [Scophthalmus maximus]AWO97701.1 family with sequence similarity 154 member B [Scophthalmus maximus]